MEVLNFFVERKSKLSSLCNCLLGQMSNFCNRTPLAVAFLPLEVKQFINSSEVFFQPFQNFEQGKFKGSSWSCGKQILGGCTSLVSLKLSWTTSRLGVSWGHLNRLIFGFFQILFFFAHAKDEMRKLTRRVQTRPMRFFFNQRGLVRDRGDYCLPAVVPLPGYLIFCIVIQNMTKSTVELKSYGVKV